MKHLIAWLVAASLSWFPVPAETQPGPFSKLALNGETPAAYLARRESIARDFIEVASDANETPVFEGADARARTALLLMSIARFESGYDLLVDTGAVRGPAGEVCLLQVLVDARYVKGRGMETAEGWTADELVVDRKKCARAALHKLRVSRAICSDAKHPLNAAKKALAGADVFSIYTNGRCVEGSLHAKHRVGFATAWASAHPAPSSSSS
jgi:hypothetical protein